MSYTSSNFGTWMPLLGIFATGPVLTACGDGSIFLIGKDNWNSLWSGRYIPGSGFQGWQFGGGIIKGKPAATCGGDNAVYIVAEDNWNSNWMGNGTEAVVILDTTNVLWRTVYTEGTGNGCFGLQRVWTKNQVFGGETYF